MTSSLGQQQLGFGGGNQNLNPNFGNKQQQQHLELQPPSLSLEKNVSSYTYASKKAKKQQWLNRFKQNKKLDTEMLLKGYNIHKESKPFLITLKGVSGIPIKDVLGSGNGANENQMNIQGSKFSLEYYITLFNKDIGTHGSFYGRTYRSQSIPLRDSGGTWDATQEEFVFFHTSYYEKTSFAVVECVIVRDFAGDKTFLSAGYALCSIFEFSGTTTIELSRGSPRSIGQIGLEATSKAQKSTGKITLEAKDFPPFEKLRQLLPQNCFCGAHEDIPGLPSDKMPNPRSQVNQNQLTITLQPKATLYIHNLQMNTSIAFENRFENFLRKMKQEKMRTARGHFNTNVTDNVYIAERRIIVSANNTWKNICDDAYVSMGPPNEQGVSSSAGSLTVKNFICHPLISLVFKVEYKAVLPSDKGNEQAFFTLGWTFHLPTYNATGALSEETLETDFEIGPGSVPTGDLLWDPNSDDIDYFQIKLKAQISTNPSAPIDHSDPTRLGSRSKPLQHNQPFGGPHQQPMAPAKLSREEQEFLDQQQLRIKQLEAEVSFKHKNEMEIQRQIEMLEMTRLREQNNGGPRSANDQMYQEQIRLLALQKDQMQNEMFSMKNDMKEYLESMKESMVRPQHGQNYGQTGYGSSGGGYGQPGYAEQFNHLQGQTLQNSTQSQIAMIGNVFYNMLNMLGESEKDKRIIGLSDNLKKMVQQSRFDDLLAPKAPYVGMGEVNLLKTTDLPLTEQINFIKMGQGELLQHPSAQVTTSSIHKDRLSLELEAADQLKASTITFKFLCYKTPWQGIENLPNKFYFQFKFFTFPSIVSDKVRIKNDQNADLVFRAGHTYYLSKENQGLNRPLLSNGMHQQTHTKSNLSHDTLSDPNLLSVTFEIDPSLSRIQDEHMKLSTYLRERFLTVDIFDGESLFLYGTCKIPLFELLRQGRGTVVRAKECEMCDPESGDFRGAIQLIMSNQGRMQSVSEDIIQKQEMAQSIKLKENSPQKQRLQPSQNESSGVQNKHKKVVKSKPMDLTKIQQTNNEVNLLSTHLGNTNYNQSLLSQMNPQQISQVSYQNADLRKKLRVDRVKKMTMGHSQASAMHVSVEDPSQPDWAKFKSLREIEIIRETKKDQILNRVMDEYCTGVEQLSVIPGQLEFFRTTIYNPFNQNEVFSIHINDPDDRFLNDKELQLVTDLAEWRHWVAAGKCKRPFAYDILTNNGDVILKPNDEVELLFKFMTTREVSLSNHVQSSKEIIKPRKIQLIIMQSNKQPYNTLDLTIVPSSAPIDHTFRFYEPQNSHVTLSIPPFIQLNHPGLCSLVSKPNASVDFNKDQSSFKIDTRTLDAPQITEMTLFVYGDQFKERLLAACQIELYSLVPIYTKIKAGIQTIQSLALPAENARQVQIYSNNHKLVYLPKRALNQTFKIIPQTVNHIQICAKTYLPIQQKIRIHCTDVNTGELVYQWLMVIDADQPTITKRFDITCKVNHASVQSLDFANKFGEKKVYEFASSKPELVFPKMDAVTFESREAKTVDLCFAPQPKYGTAEVQIYANDMEYDFAECYSLRITYLP